MFNSGLCGHALCFSCLERLQQVLHFQLDIPPVRSRTSNKTISIDDLIQLLVEGQEKFAKCNTHGKKLKYFCLEHNTPICSHCYMLGECNHHQFKFIKDFKPEIEQKEKEIQRLAGNMQIAEKELAQLLTDTQKSLENVLKVFPIPQQQDADLKLCELSLELQSLFEKERLKLFCNLGIHSDLTRKILDKLKEYESYTFSENPLNLINQNNSWLEESVNSRVLENKKILQEFLNKVSSSLDQILKNINAYQSIDECPTLFQYFDILLDTTQEETNPVIEWGEEDEDQVDMRPSRRSLPNLKLATDLRLSAFYRNLEVSQRRFSNEKNICELSSCEYVDTISFAPHNFDLSDSDLLALRYLQKKLKAKKFSLQPSYYLENTNGLERVLSFLFWNPSPFEEIEFHMFRLSYSGYENSEFSDSDFYDFFKHTLSQIPNLTCFDFNLSGGRIGNETISVLVRNVLPNLKNLKIFKFGIAQTQVKEDAILELFQHLPCVQNLLLEIGGLPISDTAVCALADSLKRFHNLKELELSLGKTGITDLGLQALFDDIPETVESLVFDLSRTGLTSKCVKNFLRFKVPRLKCLKSLEMKLGNKSLEKKVDQWEEFVEKRKQKAIEFE